MNDDQLRDLGKVGELAAIGYWVAKDKDPDEAHRLGGSAYVRSNTEYAGVAAGQISAGHFLWSIIAKLLLVPFWIGTFVAFMGGTMLILDQAYPLRVQETVTGLANAHPIPGSIYLLAFGLAFLLWAYICCWRLTMRPILKGLVKHGPGVTYADGYRGPMNSGQTVYTPRYTMSTGNNR